MIHSTLKMLYVSALRLLPETWRDAHRRRFYETLAPWKWRWRRLRGLPRTPVSANGFIRLHLGCGRLDVPGFVNVDARPWPHVHHLGGVERLPFIADGAAELVYVSHCLEHIPYREVPRVLREWLRVLMPGGRLRIAVPDFEVILLAYEASGRDVGVIQPYLLGGQDYPQNYHYSAFDEQFLSRLLREAGFENVRRWNPALHELGVFTDCSSATVCAGGELLSVSLNLEACKPGSKNS